MKPIARFESIGIHEIAVSMNKRADEIGDTVESMLKAGANVVIAAQKDSAVRHRHIDTGDMLKSIKATRPKRKDYSSSIDIYPQGKDRKGIRNADKAFILNYGCSSIPGSRWVQEANENCGDSVNAAMYEVMHAARKGGADG